MDAAHCHSIHRMDRSYFVLCFMRCGLETMLGFVRQNWARWVEERAHWQKPEFVGKPVNAREKVDRGDGEQARGTTPVHSHYYPRVKKTAGQRNTQWYR